MDKEMIKAICTLIGLMVGLTYAADTWMGWQCDNFETVTGKKSVYINFDSCYVENKSGNMVRFDSLRENNIND